MILELALGAALVVAAWRSDAAFQRRVALDELTDWGRVAYLETVVGLRTAELPVPLGTAGRTYRIVVTGRHRYHVYGDRWVAVG